MQNTDSFANNGHYKMTRKSKIGVMALSLLIATSVTNASNQRMINASKKDDLSSLIPSFTTEVSKDDINQMNLIINDYDCSDTFFQEVIDQLREDGIQFSITRDGNGINESDSTIITLDQQYSSGTETIIFAPYNNTRVGQSDSLALSMYTAFEQDGFSMKEIACGQNGYQQNEDGTIQTFFPTPTEDAIDEAYDSSFVTISFGTDTQSANNVAKSIENGLARQISYLNGDDCSSDLIYRANSEDNFEDVANYFGTDSQQLRKTNSIYENSFRDNQTIINPSVKQIHAFDSSGIYHIGEDNTKSY